MSVLEDITMYHIQEDEHNWRYSQSAAVSSEDGPEEIQITETETQKHSVHTYHGIIFKLKIWHKVNSTNNAFP